MRKVFRTFEAYKESETGHVAVIFALTAVPLLLLASVAIDSNTVNAKRARVGAALDSAAISAVINQNLDKTEREAYARDVFYSNLGAEAKGTKLTVLDSGATRVALTATSELERALPILDNHKTISFADDATAELTHGETVCMLALAPDGANTFEVIGGATLDAPTCAVQVNSIDPEALVANAGGKAKAQSFCVAGGRADAEDYLPGDFEPFVKPHCSVIPDPYADLVYSGKEECVDQDQVNILLNDGRALEPEGVTFQPGTYCGGLDMLGKHVTFAPGVYVIKDGPLLIGAGSTLMARGVTIVFQGDDAVLDAGAAATATFAAPSEGEFAGLAFFQDIHSDTKNFKTLPTGTSVVDSGSNLSIIGTAYLPEQKMRFNGGSFLDNQAPATSFIAYKISLDAGAKVEVSVDNVAAGLPPIEPRSDDGARLSR